MSATETAQREREKLAIAIRRVAEKDPAALEEVYVRTSAKLFGICLRILKDREEAEDALQEVYVKVWRSASSFDPARASPITWLATLARNRAIDNLRSSGRSRGTEPIEAGLDAPDPCKDAFSAASELQERVRLANCIGELDDHQSSAIRSAFLDGATYSELAERANIPLGTMKSWIRRGLLRVRECLGR
jgi:RNA polymerase sigma-70 factor (ECF subfamily)